MEESKYFEKIKEFRLMAKKQLGQNFLVDSKVAKSAVDALDVQPGEKVLEIGPGAGSLSYFLALSQGEADLVDVDEGFVAKLQSDFRDRPNVHPRLENALKTDYSVYDRVIGNLPYYITSALLERFLLEATKAKTAVFMVQKEVYERLKATSGEDVGPLNVLLAYRFSMKRLMNVSAASFVPPPNVTSTVFSLEPKNGSDIDTARRLYALAKGLYLHRRKNILNNLTAYLGDAAEAERALAKCGLKKNARPEELSLKELLGLLSSLQ